MKRRYQVLGVMSGTSLDGLDMAFCEFVEEQGKWVFEIIAADMVPYASQWVNDLKNAICLDEKGLKVLDIHFGEFIGHQVNNFLSGHSLSPDFISSHGHTVFHEPGKGITLQIGDGETIRAIAGYPVINDFRSHDVELGGQGAPLVPIGDKLLFHPYTYCLNLGGIANISYDNRGRRVAFDIAPANMAFNYLARQVGLAFDNNGELSRTGKMNERLFEALKHIPFYQKRPPKSLGYEDFQEYWFPLLASEKISIEDRLFTYTIHLAEMIRYSTPCQGLHQKPKMLITGGGAYHQFLVEMIRSKLPDTIIDIPGPVIIDFKEALIFAFLGVLRLRNEVNCLASVTGAKHDHMGGKMYGFVA